MKRALLDRLIQQRTNKRPTALITNLQTYAQALVTPQEIYSPFPITEQQYRLILDYLMTDRSGIIEGTAEQEWFVHVFNPPLRLMIIGAVHIAQVLAPMAHLVGYDVTVIDPRHAFATAVRFPNVTLCTDWPDDVFKTAALDHRTSVVTLTHDANIDDAALITALCTPVFYVGALGSRRTHAKRLQRLHQENGIDAKTLTRIHAPVGLAINAKTPAEIALSILAQMTEVLRHRESYSSTKSIN